MKSIDQDELFRNVTQFLQKQGVELKEGSYTRRLQQCCGLLTDIVNTTNRTVARACTEVDRKLQEIRATLRGRTDSVPPFRPPVVAEEQPTDAPPAPREAKRRKAPLKRARRPATGSGAKRKAVRKRPASG